MDADYTLRYGELYRHHWWWRAREAFLMTQIVALAPRGGFGPILDVGCGAGFFFDQLAAYGTPEGVEASREFAAQARPDYRIHYCPFDERFVPGKKYGLVLMLDVLEHLDDDVAALRCALNLLKDDGILLVTVPAFRSIWTAHDDLNHHVTRYTAASLQRSADAAGMRIMHSRYFFHWLFLAKLLLHYKEKLIRPVPRVPVVPPPWLNRSMLRLCRLEEKTVPDALAMRLGSSLLAWGRRQPLAQN